MAKEGFFTPRSILLGSFFVIVGAALYFGLMSNHSTGGAIAYMFVIAIGSIFLGVIADKALPGSRQ